MLYDLVCEAGFPDIPGSDIMKLFVNFYGVELALLREALREANSRMRRGFTMWLIICSSEPCKWPDNITESPLFKCVSRFSAASTAVSGVLYFSAYSSISFGKSADDMIFRNLVVTYYAYKIH
jgi:hypothetical protein